MAEARSATRGIRQTDEHRYKIAKSKQDRCLLSDDEAEILNAFQRAGLYPTPLFAIHRYNIDFAFTDEMVAVEYNGGNWHNTPKKVAEDKVKFEYLRSQGWTVLVFPRLKRTRLVDSGNEAIALIDLVEAVVHTLTPSIESSSGAAAMMQRG